MSLAALWTFLAVALPVLASLVAPMSTVDLAYHLRAGAEILDTRAIPTTDTWTFTALGQPWIDQQWGAQVVLHAVEAVGGWLGLVVFRAVLIGGIFGALFAISRRAGLDARTGAVLTLAAFVVAAPALGLRPQLLGMVCFIIVAWLLAIRRTSPQALWLAPVVILVWANLHGSFFLGPVLLGLAWIQDIYDHADRARSTIVVTVVSVLAACLTPTGPLVWAYAVSLSANPQVTARITEWQPTSLRDVPGILFFGSALAVVALIARRGRVVPWPSLLAMAVFFAVGVYAQRGIAWWALGATPVIAGLLADMIAPSTVVATATQRRLNLVVAGALVVVGLIVSPILRPVDPRLGAPEGLLTSAPPAVTETVRQVTAQGEHVFAPQVWGSWFEYALPTLPVAINSRIELFPASAWDTYDAIVGGVDGWQSRLDALGVRTVVVAAEDSGFASRLTAAGWTAQLADADGWVFQR